MLSVIPVLLACLTSAPNECENFVGTRITQSECLILMPQLSASFTKQHPKWEVKKLSCVDPHKLDAFLKRNEV